MAIYAIGDVQGCYQELMQLLEFIQFDVAQDELWFSGDLVNRGPQSLEVLRFVKSLGASQKTVLGNHDIHLLAVAAGIRKQHKDDALQSILQAEDAQELLDWLRQQPLMHYEPSLNFALAHAGIAPMWSIEQAMQYASEVERALQQDDYVSVLSDLFGNQPDCWHDELQGMARLRCIVNYFTRMRFCYQDGRLELIFKGKLGDQPRNLYPWFAPAIREQTDVQILFGHWAALEGRVDVPAVFALDTGCAWGGTLTALRLSDLHQFSVPCQQSGCDG